MGYVIESGTDGHTARVNSFGELFTFAVAQSLTITAAAEGTSYFIRTPVINLTTDTFSDIFYLRNGDAYKWIINYINIRYGTTDGTGDGLNRNTFGPTGGTLISSGADIIPGNSNIGVLTPLPGTFKSGAQGLIVVGGSASETLLPEGMKELNIQDNPIVIPPGVSYAVGYQPPTGNTSQNVQYTIQLYRQVGRD